MTRGSNPIRSNQARTVTAALLAVVLTATSCSSRARATVARHLIMGGPSECVTRITCLVGLQKVYGLHFRSFETLDELGPVSIAALADNRVQVVRLDSSDPNISGHHWVILQDDKAFQQAGNIIPEIRSAVATDEVRSLLDKVSDSMTQADLIALDTAVQVNHQSPQAAAQRYVQQMGLGATAKVANNAPITVGSANFSESEVLADIYADVLASAGYAVNAKIDIGSREQYQPELEAGHIDVVPEYAGNLLSFLDPTVGTVSLSGGVTTLRVLLSPKGLTVLDPSSAADADAIVVTQATAARYHLTKISDLGHRY